MNYTYFAARSDEAAAAVLDQPIISQSPSADHEVEGLLSDVVPGVQFSQEFGRFAELLIGERVDFEDEAFIVAETDDEMGIVSRVPADLARVIADADPSRLHELVPAWSEFEDFADPNEDRLRAFVDELQRLARIAVEAGGGVYSHGCA
jgi:hypothetical protein